MSNLSLRNIVKRYGKTEVVRNASFQIAEGEFVSLLGPSGCGKTTILRMVAGLLEPTEGQIMIGERDVTRLPPNKRNIGLVFQSYALFPHMTVFENVAFGLRRKGESGKPLEERVNAALEMVRLGGYGARLPRQLSGGQ
ncbi:MAG: ABC transporter ATP-binding protein, partial [Parapedobacter sp.]